MSKTAYVITDGSHNGTLKVGGVAGKIVLEGEAGVKNFQNSIFNAYDSTIVEFLAIEESLKIIKQQQKEGKKIDHVVFATDSLALICLVDPQQIREKFPEAIPFIERSKRYHKLNEKLLSLSSELGISFEMQKVKAHVPEDQASTLESIHNQVDLMAKEPKDRVVNAIQVDSLEKGKLFSVLIPKDMSDKAFEKVKSVSLSLMKQGYAPRVLIQHGANNPIKDAFREYEDLVGEGAANQLRTLSKTVYATEKLAPNAVSISGLNRARARNWLAKEEAVIDEWELNGFEGAVMNDVIASTLGNSFSVKVIANPQYTGKFTDKSSEFVLHHGEEGLMPEHLDMINRALKVHGVDRYLVTHPRFEHKERDLASFDI